MHIYIVDECELMIIFDSFRDSWQSEILMLENRRYQALKTPLWVPARGNAWMKAMKQSPLTRWRTCWGTSAHAATLCCSTTLQDHHRSPRRYACMAHSQVCRCPLLTTASLWMLMHQRVQKMSHPSGPPSENTAPFGLMGFLMGMHLHQGPCRGGTVSAGFPTTAEVSECHRGSCDEGAINLREKWVDCSC